MSSFTTLYYESTMVTQIYPNMAQIAITEEDGEPIASMPFCDLPWEDDVC